MMVTSKHHYPLETMDRGSTLAALSFCFKNSDSFLEMSSLLFKRSILCSETIIYCSLTISIVYKNLVRDAPSWHPVINSASADQKHVATLLGF